jgi:FkbM family methyltransferase
VKGVTPVTKRVLSSISRRTGRPELLAAVYPVARQQLREEIGIRAILAATLAADDTFVDVGTNRGQVLSQAVRVAPRGRHLAFEPIAELAAEVRREFPAVECRQVALGARSETAQFCHFRKLDGWSGLRRSTEISDEQGDPEYITVEVSTLDEELSELIPRVLKIDVEGAELAVIEGARKLLAGAKPIILFEHVTAAAALYGATSERLWDTLDGLGYAIFSVAGEGPIKREQFAENTVVVNWLAKAARPGSGRPPAPSAPA